jgi:hypothetical protein
MVARIVILCTACVTLSTAISEQRPITIDLTTPSTGDRVENRDTVIGVVSDPRTTVTVVVRPVGTSNYWIQPSVTVRRNGTWKVIAHFGRPGESDAGIQYEVRAFAGFQAQLKEGRINAWPNAPAISDVVEVVRR